MKQCYDNYSDKKTTDNNQVMIMIAIFTIFSGEDHSKTHIGGYSKYETVNFKIS